MGLINNFKNILKASIMAVLFAVVNTTVLYAQDAEVKEEKKPKEKIESGKITKDKNAEVVKYRRSSLHTMIIEDSKLPNADLILKSFNEAPFPDKYNNHTVGAKSFKLEQYYVAPQVAEGEKASKKDQKNYAPSIEKYFTDNKVAHQIVGKWFNRAEDGTFNMDLIGERGLYDASAQDAATANSTERGAAMLADAGEDLIGVTFVVVNYSKFVENEPIARAIRDAAYATVKESDDMVRTLAEKAADKLYEKTKDGYSVWTTAYLYQLQWTDSIAAVFYQNLWNDPSAPDPTKKEAFDNSDLFQLKLLGFQKAKSLITGLGKNAEDKDMIIKNATIKSVDAVYAKLQKKFEQFRTKTPLISAKPLGAKIGLKEGLEGGDKYEVLEKSIDAEGKVKWKRKGVIKVDKAKIWNNMYGVGEGPALDVEGNEIKGNGVEFTHFKGGKGYYPGMLLRQIN
jgi:hypothetical protein